MRPFLLLACLGFIWVCRCEEPPAMPIKEIREAAEKGDAVAQRLLSQAYLHGCGVEKDTRQALAWMLKAGEQGDLQARTFAVVLRMAWGGTKQEYDIVRPWFRQFPEYAERGVLQTQPVQTSLDPELVARTQQAIGIHLQTLAEKGDAAAQFARGAQYKYGNPVKQDDKEAVKWFLRSANGGFSPAQYAKRGIIQCCLI